MKEKAIMRAQINKIRNEKGADTTNTIDRNTKTHKKLLCTMILQ